MPRFNARVLLGNTITYMTSYMILIRQPGMVKPGSEWEVYKTQALTDQDSPVLDEGNEHGSIGHSSEENEHEVHNNCPVIGIQYETFLSIVWGSFRSVRVQKLHRFKCC